MYYNYPVYTSGAYGAAYITYTQTPETRDQFIRRFVMENFLMKPSEDLIQNARTIWDESIKTGEVSK